MVTEKEVIKVGTEFNPGKNGRISILSLSVNSEDTLYPISSNTKLIVSGAGDSKYCIEESHTRYRLPQTSSMDQNSLVT